MTLYKRTKCFLLAKSKVLLKIFYIKGNLLCGVDYLVSEEVACFSITWFQGKLIYLTVPTRRRGTDMDDLKLWPKGLVSRK